MFEKRHRITLLFTAHKAYDRQYVEGVGEIFLFQYNSIRVFFYLL